MAPIPHKVLVAGHDLKFWSPLQNALEETGLFEFRTDQWSGHNAHDPLRSRSLLEWAETIMAEWTLGNAVFYSRHKRPEQRLVTRFHLMERDTPFPAALDIGKVDQVVFVGPHIEREARRSYGWPDHKTTTVANFINSSRFDLPKYEGSRFNIGMIGVVPMRKRLDRAIDLLETLRESDERWTLHVKGAGPANYNWLWKRREEVNYYLQLYERINSSPHKGAVVFDPHGDDVPEWFRCVAYILSPSDFESFHMAVAEGLLSRTIPIVWDWEGAAEIYPFLKPVGETAEAAQRILSLTSREIEFDQTVASSLEEARSHFGSEMIRDQWVRVLSPSDGPSPIIQSVKHAPNANTGPVNIAVYGDLNMNLIDGSAVWAASLVETLAGLPNAKVFFILKAPQQRGLLLSPLERLPNVVFVRPPTGWSDASRPLTPARALDTIEEYDGRENFDAIILRGFQLCSEASLRKSLHSRLWIYLTDIPQRRELITAEMLEALARITESARFLLCQTEQIRAYLETLVPEVGDRAHLLPPMIPDLRGDSLAPQERATLVRRICYAGKFAPLWATKDLVDVFRKVRQRRPGLELHVFGDKIHNPPDDPSFKPEMERLLSKTEALYWHKGLEREQVLSRLNHMDLGWTWRKPELETHTLELSTKVLEYGAAGLPVILTRNPVNEQLLSRDYPLFAVTIQEAEMLLESLTQEGNFLETARSALTRVCSAFTFSEVRRRHLEPLVATLYPNDNLQNNHQLLI